jgi:hypothetical protein
VATTDTSAIHAHASSAYGEVTQCCYAAAAAVGQRSAAECTAAHLAVAHAAVNTCLPLQSASSGMAVRYSVSGAVHLCVAAETMLYTFEC